MNFAHVHLIMNHIPVVGIPVALVFLAYGIFVGNLSARRFALLVLIGLAAMVLPVYFTGEPAEEVIEHLPGVAESFIESHEDAAKVSLVLTLVSGALAAVALVFQKDDKKGRPMNFAVLGVAGLAVISLAYTANLGGKIRHTELRADGGAQVESGPSEIKKEDKDND
ncbi:hypothetical protein [Bdellovibrio svalbardensis]|uniref:DUF2231 domain-containing protein n=1 Tax=Bdellovibrio svalbardensis TaxID=2972972 RepID=A0ABT6DMP0_9BACT|nr:hypothetical protein [Bdellovibrio svalbardensis]MDG0818144.1 hypothetical protein [Bdellovibrio svalbardensis]